MAALTVPNDATALLASYWGRLPGRGHQAPMPIAPSSATRWMLRLAPTSCAGNRHPTLRSQLSRCTGLAIDAVAITCAALCALHDIGKLDTRFQRKVPPVADALRPQSAGIATGS